jgi:uncharacterized protein (DUF427 family)
MKAIWNDTIIAESDDTVLVKGDHYFPLSALDREHIISSSHQSTCPWKDLAHYYTLHVNGKTNENAAWYYPEPKAERKQSKIASPFGKVCRLRAKNGRLCFKSPALSDKFTNGDDG